MVWQYLKARSAAEYTGMLAIGAVIVAAWVYSLTLEYSFFLGVTPGTQPLFPYLALAFTGIGFALWGIGFACAHKPFTQVITMFMMLASGGTAVYIATIQFQAQGDAHYNLASDPANYRMALNIVGVMLLLNVGMLALKVIVWRFSQPGTGFFQHPQIAIAYPPQGQPVYIQQQQQIPVQPAQLPEAQPKDEPAVLEQTSTMSPVPVSRPLKQLPRMNKPRLFGRPGRKHTDQEYKRLWDEWEANGFRNDLCPWENPYEMRQHPPRIVA